MCNYAPEPEVPAMGKDKKIMEFDGIEIETGPAVERTIIWLHGLGADGHDFEAIVPELALKASTRFVFPHAPVRPVTINGGMAMRAWYDIYSFDRDAKQDAIGIEASASTLRRLIDREQSRGLTPQQIMLAGFSQGGAVALYTALTDSRALAGVLALSTYLPMTDSIFDGSSAVNARIPIWMAHGSQDTVVDISHSERSKERMLQAGIDVEWKVYPMAHSLCLEEVRDIAQWIDQSID
jgi:phospholipase/carboxylesterase